jgi:hypothetical protein
LLFFFTGIPAAVMAFCAGISLISGPA